MDTLLGFVRLGKPSEFSWEDFALVPTVPVPIGFDVGLLPKPIVIRGTRSAESVPGERFDAEKFFASEKCYVAYVSTRHLLDENMDESIVFGIVLRQEHWDSRILFASYLESTLIELGVIPHG